MSEKTTENSNRSEHASGAPADDPRWLDKPGSVDLLIKILIGACVLSVLADFLYHKHGEFSFQEWIGFDALYGFIAYVGLIHVAKGVRILLMRSEDYYD
jgi:hypothetical protein